MAVSVGRVSAESLFQFKGLQNWSQTSAENRLRAASLELNAYIKHFRAQLMCTDMGKDVLCMNSGTNFAILK